MKKGDIAELKMKKVLRIGDVLSEVIHKCRLTAYDSKRESIFLELIEGDFQDISLDAIYECSIISEECKSICTGRVKERYCDESGKIIRLKIENGFYKINIKSVNKQIV